jgi:hypothetical protein
LVSEKRFNKPRRLRRVSGRRDKHGSQGKQKEEDRLSILRRKEAERALSKHA